MTRSGYKLIFIFLSIFLIISCNALPAPVRNLFASPTPTSTSTPTSTATPTVTPTSTSTPLPAVHLESCAYARYCPESFNIQSFTTRDIETGRQITIQIPFDVPITFHSGWMTMDGVTLAENIPHIRFFFTIDGQDYYDPAFTVQDVAYDASGVAYPSIFTGVKTTGWKVGEAHRVTIGFEFDEEIFDGWDTYPAGTRFEYIYMVKPILKPTDTLTPTPVPTRTPLPRPTSVPYTPTAACKTNGTIDIKNDTGGFVTLYLTGPAKFTFNLAAGSQVINVCPGSYSYTANGCGGASRNGTINTGDELKFWCE